MTHRRGFSLIKLLVVLAILAILMGLLFPVFASAREKVRATTCLSNVGQLARATLLYAGLNDDHFPQHDWLVQVGLAAHRDGTSDATVLRCPDYRLPTRPDNSVETGGYARNACLQYVPTADTPSEIVLIGEVAHWEYVYPQSTGGGPEHRDLSIDWLEAPDDLMARDISEQYGWRLVGPEGEWGSQRHSGHGNYVFVDGHARSVAASQFLIFPQDLCGQYTRSEAGVAGHLRFASLPFGGSIRNRR